jgi:hypothetical protein
MFESGIPSIADRSQSVTCVEIEVVLGIPIPYDSAVHSPHSLARVEHSLPNTVSLTWCPPMLKVFLSAESQVDSWHEIVLLTHRSSLWPWKSEVSLIR